jgi:hypothetical protein
MSIIKEYDMDEDLKKILEIILVKRMECKNVLDALRFLEENNPRKSYLREIDLILDQINELDALYEKLKNR